MTEIDEQGRPEPPLSAGELETLQGFIEFQRATLAWKTDSLDAAGLNARVGVSAMTLGGMLKHLAYVEDHWCGRALRGLPPHPPWDSVAWDADADWDWTSAVHDSPEELRRLWSEAVERSRANVALALSEGDLGQVTSAVGRGEQAPSLRWILVHLIEEYSRHNGHADLLRESIDGLVGE